MVFFGNAYFAGTCLLEKPLSKYFKYCYISSKLLTVSFVWPRPCCAVSIHRKRMNFYISSEEEKIKHLDCTFEFSCFYVLFLYRNFISIIYYVVTSAVTSMRFNLRSLEIISIIGKFLFPNTTPLTSETVTVVAFHLIFF